MFTILTKIALQNATKVLTYFCSGNLPLVIGRAFFLTCGQNSSRVGGRKLAMSPTLQEERAKQLTAKAIISKLCEVMLL